MREESRIERKCSECRKSGEWEIGSMRSWEWEKSQGVREEAGSERICRDWENMHAGSERRSGVGNERGNLNGKCMNLLILKLCSPLLTVFIDFHTGGREGKFCVILHWLLSLLLWELIWACLWIGFAFCFVVNSFYCDLSLTWITIFL